jgi:hypothetical protein
MLSFDDFKKEMLKRPDSFMYCGDLDLAVWGFAGFGTNRDADLLTQSNHERESPNPPALAVGSSGKDTCII